MEIGLSQYSGMEFLQLFGGLSLAAIIAAIWLPNWLRPEGRDQSVTDEEELAYLAGGAARHAETIVAGMMASGALETEGKDKLRSTNPGRSGRGGAGVLTARFGAFTWDEAAKALREIAGALRESLIGRGLIMDRSTSWQIRGLSTLPLLFVIALGLYRRAAGAALGEPVGFLTIMLFVLGIVTLIRFFAHDPRTRAGRAAVREAQDRSSRLKRAPMAGETGTAVALFGTAVLVGTPFAPLHAMRQTSSSDSGSSSSSDSGGSGCGGGGCGGCGG